MQDNVFDDLDDNLFNEIDVSGAVHEPLRQGNQNRSRYIIFLPENCDEKADINYQT